MESQHCRRPLDNILQIRRFLCKTLGIELAANDNNTVYQILNAERVIEKLNSYSTQNNMRLRVSNFSKNSVREKLRDKVLKELIDLTQLENDDCIRLGEGGARPKETVSDAIAYIISGAPASGKSNIAKQLAQVNGAYILDSDYAKRKFPEFRRCAAGATLVHEESDKIIFSSEKGLFEWCVYMRHNIVIPVVGKSFNSVKTILERLIDSGYQIHVINVVLDRKLCTIRAYERFCETKRYVPLSYVFDEVGNEPERVYFLIKREFSGHPQIVSFTQLSTAVEIDCPPTLVETTELSLAYL